MKNIHFIVVFIILIGQDYGINSYFLYFLVIILFLMGDFKSFFYSRNNLVIPFMFLFLISIIKFWQLSLRSILEEGLLLLGVMCFTFKKPYILNIKKLNICIGLAFLLNILLSNRVLHISYNDYMNSDIGFESSMISFIIPFFFYYWLRRSNNIFILINILIVLFAGKRIAILACIVGYGYYMCRKWLEKPFFPYLMLGINLFYIFFSFLLANELFNDFIMKWFDMSVNQLTMGRYQLYSLVIEKSQIMDDFRWLYGIGLGNTEAFLSVGSVKILHNDVLKIFFEFGLIPFCLFFYYIYRKINLYQWGYVLIWNILLLTDNTLIYVPVIFSVGLMIDSEMVVLKKKYLNKQVFFRSNKSHFFLQKGIRSNYISLQQFKKLRKCKK